MALSTFLTGLCIMRRNRIFVLISLSGLFSLDVMAATAPTVAVSYFENVDGQKELDPLSKGIADMLITDLTKLSSLKVVEREKLEELLSEIEINKSAYFDKKTAQKLGSGLGAEFILTGSFFMHNGEMRIDTRLLRVETGEVLLADYVSGKKAEFFALQKKLTDKIIKSLKVKPKKDEEYALLIPETKSYEAFESYSIGIDAIDNGRLNIAELEFKKAVYYDDKFDKAKINLESVINELQNKVKDIEVKTSSLSSSLKDIDTRTQNIENEISLISTDFEKYLSIGGIVKNPTKPEEFYFNALLYQERGDLNNSIDSFIEYFKTNSSFVDPAHVFTRLVSTQKGREQSSQFIKSILKNQSNLPLEIYILTLMEPRLALKELEKLIASHKEYIPLYYIVADQYSQSKLGNRTLEEKINERINLKKFIEGHNREDIVNFFLDQRVASDWIDSALERIRSSDILDSIDTHPKFRIFPSPKPSWYVVIEPPELVKKILYRLSKSEDKKEIVHYHIRDELGLSGSGSVDLNIDTDLRELQFFYTDNNDKLKGPFSLSRDLSNPFTVISNYGIGALKSDPSKWVRLKKRKNGFIIDFWYLSKYKCSIEKIIYGISGNLDKTYKFSPCDTKNPFERNHYERSSESIDITDNNDFVTVQLKFADGSLSEVRKYFP